MIKTVLIDDHELVRTGLRHMLKTDADIQVIGEAATGIEGIQVVRKLKPDVIVLDINLPDISGLEVTNRLLGREDEEPVKILVVSGMNYDLYAFKLLEAGALSYLTKNASSKELIQALKSTYAGQRFISPVVTAHLAFSEIGICSQKKNFLDLSDRELEVMMMVIRGVEVKEIGKKLNLSSKTVHTYRGRIFKKLHVDSDASLVILAIKEGIVTLDEMEPRVEFSII